MPQRHRRTLCWLGHSGGAARCLPFCGVARHKGMRACPDPSQPGRSSACCRSLTHSLAHYLSKRDRRTGDCGQTSSHKPSAPGRRVRLAVGRQATRIRRSPWVCRGSGCEARMRLKAKRCRLRKGHFDHCAGPARRRLSLFELAQSETNEISSALKHGDTGSPS
jgi:hypothetical protein